MNTRQIQKWKKQNKNTSNVIGNNFKKNLERYNELMEKINPNDIFNNEANENKYEINKLHGELFGIDINESVMDYLGEVEDEFNWKEYWKRKKKDE